MAYQKLSSYELQRKAERGASVSMLIMLIALILAGGGIYMLLGLGGLLLAGGVIAFFFGLLHYVSTIDLYGG